MLDKEDDFLLKDYESDEDQNKDKSAGSSGVELGLSGASHDLAVK